MQKNSKVSARRELESLGVNNEKQERFLDRKVRGLLKQLEQKERERKEEAVEERSDPVKYYIGLDLGDKKSRYCFLVDRGEGSTEGMVSTTGEALRAYFSEVPRSRIALEVGTHSPWVSELLESMGHEVYVANPRKMESIYKNKRKNDRVDAWTLAMYARADVRLLHPIRHRGKQVRNDLVLLRARDSMVSARTKLINSVRGIVKSVGGRLPKCSAESFHKTGANIPESVRGMLEPVMDQIGMLTRKIREYDRRVKEMAEEKYPETQLLRQVKSVGEITSLTYVLTIEDPDRFAKSRDVGPYVGLVPREDASGESLPQLRITKTGDRMLRRLLVGSAQYMLGRFGEDCDLRRFGEKIAARGGKNAKKRAVVAVARKLAVLLHHLWRTGEVYERFHQAGIEEQRASA